MRLAIVLLPDPLLPTRKVRPDLKENEDRLRTILVGPGVYQRPCSKALSMGFNRIGRRYYLQAARLSFFGPLLSKPPVW
jgi:hypothetical protein